MRAKLNEFGSSCHSMEEQHLKALPLLVVNVFDATLQREMLIHVHFPAGEDETVCFILDHPFLSQVCVEVGRTNSYSFPILERIRFRNHINAFFTSDLFDIYEKLFDDPIHNHWCASGISVLTNTMHSLSHLDFP